MRGIGDPRFERACRLSGLRADVGIWREFGGTTEMVKRAGEVTGLIQHGSKQVLRLVVPGVDA